MFVEKVTSQHANNQLHLHNVKINRRILSVSFLACIYCFAVGVATPSFNYSAFQSLSGTSQQKIFSEVSAQLFSHTSLKEGGINNHNNLPTPCFKNQFSSPSAANQATELFVESICGHYSQLSRKLLINHQISDIIFPFHYFW